MVKNANIVGVVQHILFLRAGCTPALTMLLPRVRRIARTTAVTASAPTPLCAGAYLGRLVYDCHNIKTLSFHGLTMEPRS